MIRPATAADAAAAAKPTTRPPERPLAVVAQVGGREADDAAAGEELVLAVDPVAQGAGLGSALLAAAGGRAAWVPERDGLARAFLAARGWRETGERREDPDGLGPHVRSAVPEDAG